MYKIVILVNNFTVESFQTVKRIVNLLPSLRELEINNNEKISKEDYISFTRSMNNIYCN